MKHIYTFLCLFLLSGVAYGGSVTIPWNNGTYTGSVSGGIPEGNGALSYFVDGKLTFTLEGFFENGHLQGKGTETFYLDYPKVECKYVGNFLDSERHGFGIERCAFLDSIAKGEWRNGVQHGRGSSTTDDEKFDGVYKNGEEWSGLLYKSGQVKGSVRKGVWY